MRMVIPLVLAATLVSGVALADNRSPSQAARESQAQYGYAYQYRGGPMPRVAGQDTIERKQLASRAADMINRGDCRGAHRIAAKREDYEMVVRIDQVCATPVATPIATKAQ